MAALTSVQLNTVRLAIGDFVSGDSQKFADSRIQSVFNIEGTVGGHSDHTD